MKLKLRDQKNALVYKFWSRVNKTVLAAKFRSIDIEGIENLPLAGAFLLVCNHTARWDGLLLYNLIDRPANFLVSPNELLGAQGVVLRSMGAFPASAQYDLQAHIESQWRKGEGLVVFPEGDIYRDGNTHPFKSGAARFALNATKNGLEVPVVPMAIHYDNNARAARIQLAPAVMAGEYLSAFGREPAAAVRALTERLHREVCHLRLSLGSTMERRQLFENLPRYSNVQAPFA